MSVRNEIIKKGLEWKRKEIKVKNTDIEDAVFFVLLLK